MLLNSVRTQWFLFFGSYQLVSFYCIYSCTLSNVSVTMCVADCWTDHRLVVSKLNLRIQPARRPQGKKAPKRLDVSKLNRDSMRQAFLTDICNQLDAINLSSEYPEENWTVSFFSCYYFRSSVSQTSRLV